MMGCNCRGGKRAARRAQAVEEVEEPVLDGGFALQAAGFPPRRFGSRLEAEAEARRLGRGRVVET